MVVSDPPGGGQSVAYSDVRDVYQLQGVHGSVTINSGAAAVVVSWPVWVGAVPVLAHCYQTRPETELLRQAVEPGETAVLTQVLTGLGGVGKSQLAAAYAWSRQAELDVLVWVNAGRRESILGGYAQAAAKPGYRADGPGGGGQAGAESFLSWMQSCTDRVWLVVLDDLTDPADLRGLWPSGPGGSTVVTTRRTDAALSGHGRRRVPVGLFTPSDALDYLAAKLDARPGSVPMVEAEALAADLGYLPLALAQAGAFVLDRGESCAGYRARLADRRRSLAELFPPDASADDYQATATEPDQATVAATWSISIEAADHLPPHGLARRILQILAVLDPDGIPVEVLDTDPVRTWLNTSTAGVTAGSTDVDPANEGDSTSVVVHARDCRDAVTNLARFSLVGIDPTAGAGAVRVHALIQRATLQHLTPTG